MGGKWGGARRWLVVEESMMLIEKKEATDCLSHTGSNAHAQAHQLFSARMRI